MPNKKIHSLKLNTRYVDAVNLGTKTFEIRKNDRNFQAGDYIVFNSVNDDGKILEHPISKQLFIIKYLMHIKADMSSCGITLQDDCVVFSIRKLTDKEKQIVANTYDKKV